MFSVTVRFTNSWLCRALYSRLAGLPRVPQSPGHVGREGEERGGEGRGGEGSVEDREGGKG